MLHGRSHCLPNVHFANFNCPLRTCTLYRRPVCLSSAQWRVTLPAMFTRTVCIMACHIACFVHYGRSHYLSWALCHVTLHVLCIVAGVQNACCVKCTLAVLIACLILCGRSDHLTCALSRFHCLSCAKGQVTLPATCTSAGHIACYL